MQHLMIETIARLLDEAPTPDEANHLERCDECRAELEAMRADAAALRNLPMIEPPPTEWPDLETRLLEEGLVRRKAGAPVWQTAAMRAAAAVLLFVGGAGTGMAWMRAGAGPLGIRPIAGNPSTASMPSIIAATAPGTPEETVMLYRQAEALYLDMVSRVAELNSQEQVDPLARLAALESIVGITRSALDQAPADPVLNSYHLTAIAQKEATLRQIAASKPGRWF
jgi:hypothetical protein